jgi:hypothetical protein
VRLSPYNIGDEQPLMTCGTSTDDTTTAAILSQSLAAVLICAELAKQR